MPQGSGWYSKIKVCLAGVLGEDAGVLREGAKVARGWSCGQKCEQGGFSKNSLKDS